MLLDSTVSNGFIMRRRRWNRTTPFVGKRSCSRHIQLRDVLPEAASVLALARFFGERTPWNHLPRSLRIQNTAASIISFAKTTRRMFSRQCQSCPASACSSKSRAIIEIMIITVWMQKLDSRPPMAIADPMSGISVPPAGNSRKSVTMRLRTAAQTLRMAFWNYLGEMRISHRLQ